MISVLILTTNSEETLKECLESIKGLADEIVVVDGGSVDNTIKIAKSFGAKVVENTFKNFADQRNLAASLAHNDWIFYIDSDEKVTSEFIDEFKAKIGLADSGIGGFFIKRKTYFLGKDWGLTDQVQRVFKKSKLKEWRGVVHETPVVDGNMGVIDSPIIHNTHRNLEQMVAKTNEWSEYEAELRLKNHHPKMTAWRFFRVMATGFFKSYFKEGGWKNGTAGIVESIFQSFSMFITYAKLWEKQNKK